MLAGRKQPTTVGGRTGRLWWHKDLRLAYIAQHSLEEDEMRSVGLRHGKRGKAVEALINRIELTEPFLHCDFWVKLCAE
eukprot:g18948.t1